MSKELLDLYTYYLISQNGHATATGLSALLGGDISHDKVTRFLRRSDYTSKDLWAYNKLSIREAQTGSEGKLCLDDTIEDKTYTDENDIVCWHYSHAKGRHVKGINILNAMIRYGDFAMPIAYDVVKKDICYFNEKEGRDKRRASRSKNDMFRELVRQTVKNKVPFDYVLADNWYGSKDNMLFLHFDLKKTFILGLKSNRLVALSKEQQKNGQFQQAKNLDWKNGESRCVYLKDLPIPVQLLKKIFTNEDGSTGTLYLVSNDLAIGADRMYEVYQKRWQIEVFHQSIKQNPSLEKSPTKIVRTQLNHIYCAMVAYSKLELLKIKSALNHFAIKKKLLLKANQAALSELRLLQTRA